MTELERADRRRCTRRRFLKRTVAVGAVAAAGRSASALTQPSGRVLGFDHVSFPMQHTERMLAFYRALGMTVNEGPQVCSVHFGDQKINLHQPAMWERESFTLRAPAARPPCGDFCFVWDGTHEGLTATLDRLGVEVIEGPVARPGGRAGGSVGGTSRYVRDPDGNLVEFIIYD